MEKVPGAGIELLRVHLTLLINLLISFNFFLSTIIMVGVYGRFQFKDPLIGLLLVSAAISLLTKEFDDAISITVVRHGYKLLVYLITIIIIIYVLFSRQLLSLLQSLLYRYYWIITNSPVINNY